MASTSASSIRKRRKRFKYDVFLSFRGEDTRKSFVDHLYHALDRKSIVTYKDDQKIKKGERIGEQLLRSIEDSKFYIIVFSKMYASSSWCLDELVKIIECQKTDEHTAYPVFYDVEPTEVRKQSGAVGEAFAKHVQQEKEAVEKWRNALREAADLAGWELKNTFDGHESMFIEKIVEEILLGIRYTNSSVGGKLIGMETRAKHMVSLLETTIDDVRMIGIKGIGGGGKTTLAKVVFDQISPLFEGSSFVENIRECSKASMWGLKSLQKQVLVDVTHDKNIVKGVSDLTNMMKKIMCGRKVLVVLDDVDDTNQLEALAGELNWFKAGSRIIITTRDKQVLVAHEVPNDLILNVNLLSNEEANCLFNRHAFERVTPNQGYEKLTGQAVSYANGLPLTIKVLGSFLRKKSVSEWADALERLKKFPLKETLNILKLSYDSLEVDQKEIFLDVACMLKGWRKEEAIIALESRGFHAKIGLKVLELKSLITVSSNEKLGMHDHLAEMGQNIVRHLHPNEPCKHSRLWIQEEIEDILVKNKGTEATRCINMQMIDPRVLKGLNRMTELRFLNVIAPSESPSMYPGIGEDSLYLPNGLQYFGWEQYPFTFLPKCFEVNDLVGLKMHSSKIDQLCKVGEREGLKNLRFIDMLYCKLRSLDIGLIPNLERLSLEFCDILVELRIPVQSSNLTYLNLRHVRLWTLDLRQAQNLDELKVEECNDLIELLMPIELKHLTIRECSSLKTIDLRRTQNIETLNLGSFYQVELHMPIESPKLKTINIRRSLLKTLDLSGTRNLEMLDLIRCDNLVEFHMSTDNHKLKTINSSCSEFRTLNLIGTRHLDELNIEQCEDLVDHKPIRSPELQTINIRCSKLRALNLSRTKNIRGLNLVHCKDLIELCMPIECPELKTIGISCSKLTALDLTGTWNLERLNLEQCSVLVELRMPIECPELKTINIRCSRLATLDLTRTGNLERLDLKQCEGLVELCMPGESLKLKAVNIHCSNLRTLNLGMTPHLECLELHDYSILDVISAPVGCLSGHVTFRPFWVNQVFPVVGSSAELHLKARSVGKCALHPDNNLPMFHFECVYRELVPLSTRNLEKLKTFSLCPCTNLVSLSERICGLQRLRKLTLVNDISEVPKEIERLECLEELTLLSTKIEYLPDSICALKQLKSLRVESCSCLKQLPEDLGRLECLEELHLTDCTSLQDIPNSICKMKLLNYFNLRYCILVKKLPREMGCLTCLKWLNIEGTSIIDLPDSISQLEDLILLLD